MSGEAVTGNIYLNLNLPVNAYTLDIQIKGTEKTQFEEWEEVKVAGEGNGQQTRRETVKKHGNRVIMDYKVPLFTFPGGIAAPGQYTFPFSF